MKAKEIILFLGLVGIATSVFMFYWIFFKAYFYPEKLMTFMINVHGEANFEFVILIVFLPCIAYVFHRVKKEWSKLKQ